MDKMHKYISILLLVISLLLGGFAFYNKVLSDELAVKIQNQTGSCIIDGTCLHDQSNSNFIILSIVSILVFGSGLFILLKNYRKKKTIRSEKKVKVHASSKLPNVSGEARKLHEILVDSGGSVLQGELVSKSGMTKVKVSRLLDRMEMQGLIERRRHGMSNLVVLKNRE